MRVLLAAFLAVLVACAAADPLKIKLRKIQVPHEVRRAHHANKSRLITQQVGGDGATVDIINFMDAQVRLSLVTCPGNGTGMGVRCFQGLWLCPSPASRRPPRSALLPAPPSITER